MKSLARNDGSEGVGAGSTSTFPDNFNSTDCIGTNCSVLRMAVGFSLISLATAWSA